MAPSRLLLMIATVLALPGCEDDEKTPLAESASTTTVSTSENTATTATPTTTATIRPASHVRADRYRGALLSHTDRGMTIDGRPRPGLTHLSGALMEGHPPSYVIDVVRDAVGDMVWFGRFEGKPSGDDPPPTRITDTLAVPAHPPDQYVQIIECGPRGQDTDPEVFALVRAVPNAPTYPVVQAWRADRESQKIADVPADRIECENVGYGA